MKLLDLNKRLGMRAAEIVLVFIVIGGFFVGGVGILYTALNLIEPQAVFAKQKIYQNTPGSVGVTARVWQDMSIRDQNIYLEGILDAFILVYGQTVDPALEWAHRYIENGMYVQPVVEKVKLYLTHHPEAEHIIMTMVVQEVLKGWDDADL